MIPAANILQPLIDVANAVLQFFHDTSASAGAASIIALTVCTRALLIPLTYKQLKGMRALQALQPQIKEIKAKYKNDQTAHAAGDDGLLQREQGQPLCLLHPAGRSAARSVRRRAPSPSGR